MILSKLKGKIKLKFVSKKIRLNAGDEFHYKVDSGYHWVNHEMFDIRSQTYLKGLTKSVVFRFQGVIAHDATTTSNVGYGDGTIDEVVEVARYGKVVGMGSVTSIEEGDNLDAITTAEVDGPNVVTIQEDV